MKEAKVNKPARASPQALAIWRAPCGTRPLLAGIRAGGTTRATFPAAWSDQWCERTSGGLIQHLVRLPLRGQRRLDLARRASSSCFPFNCAGVKAGTSTNAASVSAPEGAPYNQRAGVQAGGQMATIDELAERVERLLLRHEELQRTHRLTVQQLGTVSAERDSLKSRLAAARQRVDALLDRLPSNEAAVPGTDTDGSRPTEDTKA
jgi:cell division protein ZapB